MKKPDLSIIIINYKTPQLTTACLASIYRSKTRHTYEVLVLDNASGDGSGQIIKKKFPQVKLIEAKKNYGFAKGNNLAAKAARGTYYLFLNSDTEIFTDTLEKAVTRICQDETIGVLGVKLLNKNRTVQASVFRFPSLRLFFAEMFFLAKVKLFDDYRYFRYDRERFVDFVSGAFMLLPGTLFRQVRGFDDRFFMYAEETDLCQKITATGARILFSPVTKIIHYGGGSKRAWQSEDFFHQSKITYIRKHSVFPRVAFFILALANFLRLLFCPWRMQQYGRLAGLYFRELWR